MNIYEVENTRSFMNSLFIADTFDKLDVMSVSISVANTYTIDGHINTSFYTSEELSDMNNAKYQVWSVLKPLCFSLIKGSKAPLKLSFVFRLPEALYSDYFDKYNFSSSDYELISDLCINIRYENNAVTCTCGTSLKTFSLDKSIEHAWDEVFLHFMNSL